MKIHQNFTGGNIRVTSIQENHIYLENELRDTQGDWFYWAFCVEGAEGQTLTFHFGHTRLGYFGPAISHDLTEWHWLGTTTENEFTYTFTQNEHKVYFAHSMLYHPARFLALAKRLEVPVQTLCQSQKGRAVPYVTIGDGEMHILLTARHHACESTGSYVLEGVLTELAAHPIPGATIFCVPFVDYDGVVDGDQGKGRAPHDHNRDYDPNTPAIYPTTAAIRAYADANGCHFGFDFHSPWHLGGVNDHAFIVQNSFEKLNRLNAFGECLEESIAPDAFPYAHANDFPFGKDWNQGGATFAAYMMAKPENKVAFTLETAYFGTHACPTTAQNLLALGTSFAHALKSYIAHNK